MNYGLKGKVAVISGGTSGIGLATARQMLADGARVFLLGRSLTKGAAALASLSQFAERVIFFPTDVRLRADCKQVASQVQKSLEELLPSAKKAASRTLTTDHASVDILINAAGIYQEQGLAAVTESSYADIMDTNLKGTLFLTQALVPLLGNKSGVIINIASDAGISGNYGCAVYCASKGAVVALTRALALDLAPRVRVNCVCPADVATPLVTAQLQEANYTLAEMAEAYPLGRIGQPEEIAHVICSLASPMNSFMTGSIVAVDGGLTAK